ncbi:sentrin-specific protease 5 [Sarcophilus harrisii]|uniref:SUMO specific peptidase 5 n=1 Tax=Sarcophilus harrisii TaxID=9305 RepID=A0A7N4PRB8_SARHA|nr:sentrin-specific protease 5 [Sarcophilus harrisii]XP_031813386.1 sentrin-specific protease 5 [Sarcophilus harrisii]
MKGQRRTLLSKQGRLPAFSEKWASGFEGLNRSCLLHAKQESRSTWHRLYRSLQRRRQALWLQRKRAHHTLLAARTCAALAAPQGLPGPVSPHARGPPVGSLPAPVESPAQECRPEEELRKAAAGLPVGSVLGAANGCKQRTDPQDPSGLRTAGGEGRAETGPSLVTLRSRKGNGCCCRCLPGLDSHRMEPERPSLIAGRPQAGPRRPRRVSLLRLYKKLSMIRFRYRILRSPRFRTRSRTCKLRQGRHRSWVQKVARDRQQQPPEGCVGGTRSSLPLSGPNSPSLLPPAPFPEMDCSGPAGEGPEPCGGQPDGSPAQAWDPVLGIALTGDGLLLEQLPEDLLSSETEPETVIVGLEDQARDGGGDEEKPPLPDQPEEANGSGPEAPAEEPASPRAGQDLGVPDPMEPEAPRPRSIFSAKLLDHPYCKNPLEAPSQPTGLKGGRQVGGGKSAQKTSPVKDEELSSCLCGFLDEVMKKYGSLVPLCEKDVLGRLKEVFNEDFSNRKPFINREITNYRARHPKSATCNFRVFYNRHMLDMDDLATLDGQNWLNDQVINMYGELIMDAVPDKVHFFNSFFHRQLVTKGYNGVKRWTKKVDLFKKSLLLIPIHLEVHWSLITVTLSNRIISFYDSQGIHFKFCVENIRKYLLTEAREKNRPEFLQGWQTAVTKCIPQQKNDSDCGVFVLQYCKCLAFERPFQFSQEDMPRVRRRIYKELCERRLLD